MPTTTTRTQTRQRQPTSAGTNGHDGNARRSADPRYGELGREVQRYGTLRDLPIGLPKEARKSSCQMLNQVLADTNILYALYKKAHWNVAGPTFYQLHLLFDKHAEEQLALVDLLAERVQTLGGIAAADPRQIAEITGIQRAPDGAEDVPAMITRLLQAHEIVIKEVRDGIEQTEQSKDWGSNDLLMSEVLRRNELQVWFVGEHLVDVPLLED
ncbi:MAG TPA: DNA starvation/stationary phase protection protein [Candidatus Limnocylindria bacterium]|nr:DNA starvation/stationary phase protection protein [Candidatus Limnocylindria bacterium]